MKNALRRTLLFCALWLCACSSESSSLTQIIVEVDSDLSVPDQLDRVTVKVEQGQASEASADLTKTPLPRTLGLVHSGGPLGPFTLRAVGWHKGAMVVETSLSTSFKEGQTVHVSLHLDSACADVTCPSGETCNAGVCEPMSTMDTDAATVDPDASDLTDAAVAEAGSDASSVADTGMTASGTCTIAQPSANDTFQRNVAFNVQGSCRSDTGSPITQGLVWSSDQDGMVGRGANPSVTLMSVGTHVLSLCIAGAAGVQPTGCAQVSIAVAMVAQPTASIVSVTQGANNRSPYQSGAPIVITGEGTGVGVTLSFSDSMQGALGAGPMVTLQNPSVGKHTVTLTVTDRSGRKNTVSVTFPVLAQGQSALLAPLGADSNALKAVTDLAEKSNGVVYAASTDGRLYSVSVGANEAPQVALDKPPLQGTVQDVLLDAANSFLYLASSNGLTVCVYTAITGPTGCTTYQDALPSSDARAVFRMPQTSGSDKLLVGTDQGLFISDSAATANSGTTKINGRAVRAIVGDRNAAWLATDQGLYRYTVASGTATRITSGSMSSASWNTALLGAGGAVWLGSTTGLTRFSPSSDNWTSWRMADGLIANAVSSIASETLQIDGMAHEILWIGTSGGVSRFDVQLGSFQSFTMADGLPSNNVTKVLVLSDGTKLFATDAGIARYDGR